VAVFRTDNLRLEERPEGVRVLWLDVAGRTLNVFTRQVLVELEQGIERVKADDEARLLVLRSEKPSGFMAGADLHEFSSVDRSEDAEAISAFGQNVFNKLAALNIPTIAIIHGPCLGGGLEVALACDYRLVLDHPKTQLGLPEVEIGLVPGWGGCQRLPRVVGLERALQMILAGRRLNGQDALRWGLADATGSSEQELAARLALLMVNALREGKRPRGRLPLCTWRQRVLESTPVGRRIVYRVAERLLRRRVPDDMPAPYEALRAVQAGISQGLDAGLAAERKAAGRLATTRASRNLIRLFFQREAARKPYESPERGAVRPIRRVAIVGAGTMGAGIAQLAAIRGCTVTVREINDNALTASMQRIAELFHKAVANRVLAREAALQKLEAIRGTTAWDGFAEAELIVEAVVEDLQIKQALFRDLEEHTSAGAILASNTSSFLVTDIARGLKYPERVGGLHFFNPVHKMPLVEVIEAQRTTEPTLAGLSAWAVALGKTPIAVKDSPGFLVNRVLMPYLAEAVLLAAEGMAIDLIDQSMRRFGMPMGPFELLDQVGLDVATHIARSMGPIFAKRWTGNSALEGLPETFEQFQRKQWLGQKSGLGFYRYHHGKKKVNCEATSLLPAIERQDAALGIRTLPRAAQIAQARERLVLLMVNEAAACVGEGLVADDETLDLAMVLGTGWAPHRGGPLRHATDRGVAEVVGALEALEGILGPRFAPCARLRAGAGRQEWDDRP
jgi:3-hydroxyacyl-CoA dehydrogenase / enoyl-CoA hydratase / 3-hydroxybutyryl-CoA epimerase